MKQILSYLFFIMIANTNVNSQPFMSDLTDIEQPEVFSAFSPVNNNSAKKHRVRKCMTTKVGIVSLAAGSAALIAGISMVAVAENGMDPMTEPGKMQGQELYFAGSVILLTGVGLFIGGTIYDHNYRKVKKLRVILPKKNQIGLAYNF